jgi:polyisoprenoid-binding protein YceI
MGLRVDTGDGTADRLRGTWTVDGSAASVAFSGRSSRLAPVFAARFCSVAGSVQLADDESASRVDVDVDLTSMTTGNSRWDDLLSAVDPFDVVRHPVGCYRSASVRLAGAAARVDGFLALCGRSVPVRLVGTHALLGDDRARLRAAGEVDRRAFGLRVDLPGCGFLVPSRLRVEVDVEVVRERPPARPRVPRPRLAPAETVAR